MKCMRLARGPASAVLAAGLLIASSGPVRSERLELLTRAAATPDVAAAQSFLPAGSLHVVSDDGRYVVFLSKAANLVSGVVDRNSGFDVFVRDTVLGTTELVSASVMGRAAGGLTAAISGDGGTVALVSGATDLVPGQVDVAGTPDLFVWQRSSGSMRLVTRAPGDPPTALGGFDEQSWFFRLSTDGRYLSFLRAGAAFRYDWASDAVTLVSHVAGNPAVVANGATSELDASTDGRFVAFSSAATDLVAGVSDTNDRDVFLWDGATGVVDLVSHSAGLPLVSVTEDAGRPTISADGAFIALQSAAGGLVAGLLPTSSNNDLYLWSRAANTIQLVSHAAHDSLRRAGARDLAVVSADGRFVAFASSGTDLVAGQAGPPGPVSAVYRFDRLLDASLLVSHSHTAANVVAGVGSWRPRMSGDGRWISFLSGATDLVAGTSGPSVAPPFPSELYLFDAASGSNLMLSRTEGTEADHGLSYIYGFDVAASAALVAWADVAGRHDPTVADPPGVQSVFSYRIGSGVTELVSRRAADRPAATATAATFSYSPQVVLSAGGAKVALLSSAADLVAEPYGYWLGILAAFLWDRPTASIHELDRPLDQLVPASGPSVAAAVSVDGSTSLILSANPALVPGQINDTGPAVGNNLFWRQNDTGVVTLLSHADGEPLHGLAQDLGTVEVSRSAGFAATVREDVNGQHVVLYDLAGGTSTSLATTVEGSQAPSSWSAWWLSAGGDGRWWALLSPAGDVVPGQVDEPSVDAFLYDRETASYQLVSHVVDNVVTAAGGVSMARVTLDGRFVVFVSTASNLAAGQVDAPDTPDVFLFDRLSGAVSLVSHAVGAPAQAGNGESWEAAIDADGRHVVFSTMATDVVSGASDANASPDVVLVDRLAGSTRLVSHADGQPTVAASGSSSSPVIADDGATIAFVSTAPDLVPGQVDTNGAEDVFVTELRRQRTRLVSFSGVTGVAGHVPGAGGWGSIQPVLSPEGATVAFSSQADDLVAGDYNGSPDGFLYVITEPVLEAPDKSLISEPAGTTTFRVWLSHPPLAPVTVPLRVTTPSACTAPPAVLLDGGNWELGVVVTVTAVDDAVVDGPEPCLVALDPLTGADVNLAGFDLPDVLLTVADDDADAVHLLSDGFEGGGVDAWAVAAGN